MVFKCLLFCTSLAFLATALFGCGTQPSPAPTPAPATNKTTVIIMRHCVRSTDVNGVKALPNLEFYDNYSSQPWPPFSALPMRCMPRGEELVEAQGRWWKSQGGFEEPLHLVADLIPGNEGQRDNDTMRQFMKGLGISNQSAGTLDHGPFAPLETAACLAARPNKQQLKQSAEDHLNANPPPDGYRTLMDDLFSAMGTGVAGDWRNVSCAISWVWGNPLPTGACQAAAEFAERLLMEWGSGMAVGWGKISPVHIPKLLTLHAWHFFNRFAPKDLSRLLGSSIVRQAASVLEANAGGTRIYVGHDTDLMVTKGVLGLRWKPDPFPVNATLPGSMLRLVREGDLVTASYIYVKDYGVLSGEMASVEAKFDWTSSAAMYYADFVALVDNGIIKDCAYSGDPLPAAIVV